MVSVNFNNNNVKVYQTGGVNKVQPTNFPAPVAPVSNPIVTTSPPIFKAEHNRADLAIRTRLVTDDEKKKYNELTEALDGKYKK